MTRKDFADLLAHYLSEPTFAAVSERKIGGARAVFTATLDDGEVFEVSVRKVADAANRAA